MYECRTVLKYIVHFQKKNKTNVVEMQLEIFMPFYYVYLLYIRGLIDGSTLSVFLNLAG